MGHQIMNNVVGYARVSTKEQTVENQKQQITSRGYSVSKWFTDEATSGSVESTKRLGLKSLLDYVREGDILVVTAIDRLGRNTIDVLSTVTKLSEKGVKVISLREGVDLSTPTGIAVISIMASLAQLEKDLISERRKAGIQRAQSSGVHCGRPIKAEMKDFENLLSEGLSPKEIMITLGISKATFYRMKTKSEY